MQDTGNDTIDVVVEIPRGSHNAFDDDHRRGVFVLNRVLSASVRDPMHDDFMPGSLAQDGDPLEALAIVEQPTFCGAHPSARPIGMLDMGRAKGHDQKILAVPVRDPRFDEITDMANMGSHWVPATRTCFRTYKPLEDKRTDVVSRQDGAAARSVMAAARAAAGRGIG